MSLKPVCYVWSNTMDWIGRIVISLSPFARQSVFSITGCKVSLWLVCSISNSPIMLSAKRIRRQPQTLASPRNSVIYLFLVLNRLPRIWKRDEANVWLYLVRALNKFVKDFKTSKYGQRFKFRYCFEAMYSKFPDNIMGGFLEAH